MFGMENNAEKDGLLGDAIEDGWADWVAEDRQDLADAGKRK